MHATMKSMLRRAHALGLNWVSQIPFALLAMRQAPSRSTGFSSFELVYCRNVWIPLDVLYSGWREKRLVKLSIDSWIAELCERLEVMRGIATGIGLSVSKKRKTLYDRGKVDRQLKVGELVFCRIPEKNGKLEDQWEGTLVVRKLSKVNYQVKEEQGREQKRTIHINKVKLYKEREADVFALTVIAEDMGLDESKVRLKGAVGEEGRAMIEKVLEGFQEEYDVSDGYYKGGEAIITIDTDAKPISHNPYHVPKSIKENVKAAIDQLLEEDRVEPTDSPWAAEVIPIPKPDCSLHLCMDYRGIDAVTSQIQRQIPQLVDLLGKVGKAKCLSKLDVQKGFYQIILTKNHETTQHS